MANLHTGARELACPATRTRDPLFLPLGPRSAVEARAAALIEEELNRTVEETQITRLSAEDQAKFAELLLNPPALAPSMQRARDAHSRLVTESI
jgi:hypothetical protein